ncbi:MAG: dihydropteroate synthase [Actinobacteria bacterium]|nr:dihydropteroate synthase [Actinomycetota bacterium]
MPDIELRFGKDMLICEGAMGTMLQRQGMPAGACPEHLNVLDPEMVIEVHRYYHLAGAHCAITNTFGGTRAKLREYGLEDRLEELNLAGVMIAKQVHPEHVLADVGPCGLVMQPLGSATFEEVFAQYFEQISVLAKAEPDAILIETMVDISDARAAVLAARAACDLPVLVTCTFDESGRMDLSGTDPATAAVILEAAGADAVGLNCGLGPAQIYPLLCAMSAATKLPLIVQPNAGLPTLDANDNTIFPGTPEEMAEWGEKFREVGAQLVGSCCGSTPAFTGALNAALADRDVLPHLDSLPGTALSGPRTSVYYGAGRPTLILGERINPTGKPVLAEELRTLSMSTVRAFAAEQTAAGANILDVNVGAADVDEVAALPVAVRALVGSSGLPLALDTTNYEALEKALRIYPGRALINSCNGERSSYEKVLPLAKQYGASVVVLALDENGIPATIEGRLEIVERIRVAAHNYGLSDKDLIVDALTMTAAADPQAPEITLGALRACHKRGIATVLGVSNVSHSLPNRPVLNAAFAAAAVAAGMDVAIVNPNNTAVIEAIRAESDKRVRGESDFETAFAAWQEAYRSVMDSAAQGMESLTGGEAKKEADRDPRVALNHAILLGDEQGIPALVDAAVASGVDPAIIIPEILTPAIQGLGDAYGRGEVFLPQLMVAADAMTAAHKRVKELLPASSGQVSGKVVFCTVKGDIHSIGKDICVSLLESQN